MPTWRTFKLQERWLHPWKTLAKHILLYLCIIFSYQTGWGSAKEKNNIVCTVSILCTTSALLCGRSLHYPHRCGSAKHPPMAQTRFKLGTTLQKAGVLTSHQHHTHNLLRSTPTYLHNIPTCLHNTHHTPFLAAPQPYLATGTPHPNFAMLHPCLATPHPYLGTPNHCFATPLLSYATPNLSYATPNLSYATPLLSYPTPWRYYATPLLSYATSLLS